MTDASVTPQPTPKSVQLVQEAGGLRQFLYELGNELKTYYQEQIENEKDAVKRIPLHNDMLRVNTMIDLGR